jgi:hypothetical protein
MTLKDKAKELVEKYNILLSVHVDYWKEVKTEIQKL